MHTMYLMKAAFIAFSLEHVPHIRVETLPSPVGATLSKELRILSAKSMGGKTPSEGLFTRDMSASG